jgi:hypothetical protein
MWGKYRRGQHLSIAVPPEVKSQLIHRKALGQGGIGAQIVEALQQRWGGATPPGSTPHPTGGLPGVPVRAGAYQPPPAVARNPAEGALSDLVVRGRFAGMRQQRIEPAARKTPVNRPPVDWS